MHFEVRGLIEEHIDYFINHSAQSVVGNENINHYSQEELTEIAAEAMFNRLMGFHQMWCFIGENTPEEGHGSDMIDIVADNYEQLAYSVDHHLEEYEKLKQTRQHQQQQGGFDIDPN